ncbi:MAG: YceI family protein [Candidatus Pacebacteria bacterium]|nr:YceI family protein [Candidatus Paceibacterota bacterium]
MKAILITIIVLVAGYFIWKTIQTKPDASLPTATVSDVPENENVNFQGDITKTMPAGQEIDNEKVTISFKGFGPGKEHTGDFSDVRSNLSYDASDNLTGTIIVGMDSLKANVDDVTKHLKTDAFFDVVKYPTAKFTLESVTGLDAQGANATGTFTIHGVTKKVSFPISFSSATRSYTAKFNIDMKEFGIDQTFANEVVEVSVVVPLKKLSFYTP